VPYVTSRYEAASHNVAWAAMIVVTWFRDLNHKRGLDHWFLFTGGDPLKRPVYLRHHRSKRTWA